MTANSSAGAGRRLGAALRTLGLSGAGLAGLGLFLAWMGGAFHHKVAPGVVLVERPQLGQRPVVTAERSTSQETVAAVGSVQPRRKTEAASQLLANIREVRPRPGDAVKAGDILVILDDRELVAQQREAAAALATAEADLATRRSDYERIRRLRGTGAVSDEDVNRIEGAFRITETQVRRAKETIGRIEVQLTYTRIVASADGVIADRLAEPGDLATPGRPILTMYDPNDLELQAHVPESLAAGIRIGQPLEVRIDANGWTTAAAVREIVPLAQQASRSVLVKLALPPTPSALAPTLPGMFGRALIPVGARERIWLPAAAIQQQGQLDLVEVVEADGSLARRFVRVGRSSDGKVEILSGLTGGERVALPAR